MGRVPLAEQIVETSSGRPRIEAASELVNVIQRLSLARTTPEIQEIVRTAARRLTGADGATVILRDGPCCYYADEDAISPLWKGQCFPLEKCISGWAMINRRPVVIEDIYEDDRVPHDAYRPTFVRSLAMVPIRQTEPLGAIGNYWARRHRPAQQELEMLQALADSTAVAIENAGVYRKLEEARKETLQRLALAAEYRDGATYEHTERVARISYLIAQRLGLSESESTLIAQAAPLHDIGKLSVSDAVLRKRGKLTASELGQVKLHARAGASILSGSNSALLRMAEEIALTHHEWWDGSGYPDGLRGDEIPVGGRIVALADVFDALTHERPYKRAWSLSRAVAEISQLAGRQFDPSVVDAFQQLGLHELAGEPVPD